MISSQKEQVDTTPMAKSLWVSLVLLVFLNSQIPSSQAQQEYVNNKQLDCDSGVTYNATLGNLCNGVSRSCNSYLTFRSISPLYNTPSSIAFLLNSTPIAIAKANNISDVAPIPDNTMVIVPVNCSCSGRYYQHNASYVLKQQGETYFSVSNNTYQALTTCQAIEAQNTYDKRNLLAGMNLNVPLRCACPTRKQEDSGFKYLLTYLVALGESVASIGGLFGVDEQSVLDANELSSTSIIFYFTPITVPLRKEPDPIKVASPPPPSPPPPPPTTASSADSSSSKKWVIVGVTVGAVLILLLGLSGFLFCYRRRRRQRKSQLPSLAPTSTETTKKTTDSGTTQSWSISSEGIRYAIDSLTVYKFEDLQKATSFFSEANKIKGSVYRATFKGDDAAVKIYKGDVSKEISILKRLNHTNITRLSGFCVHKGDTYLVYEFAENGSLDDWLHPNDRSKNKFQNSSSTLNWRQRVQIAHDIADALNYLHNYTNPPHIHKNLQSRNVLLDGNFRAKVSNFGLARELDDEEGGFQVTRHVIGTQGYMAPEYMENGVITPKMDVFALGVVILELISGKEAIVGDEKLLSSCAREVVEGENVREKLRGFVDPSFGDEYPLDLVYSMAQVAKRCVEQDINSRPGISEVLTTLSKIQSSTLDWDPSDELDRSRSVSQVSEAR
ncbi:protein LYK5-like [Neltuma alba]|uniref:protein LYK5-like n=1 Tax=Neltuma alba TaxID=207710 RepID=UPI0010A41E34|nr:protein LYK5-like [Prosopis alba]